MFSAMVSSNAVAILAILAFGGVDALSHPKDKAALSTTAHYATVSASAYSATTAAASHGSHTSASGPDDDYCEDDSATTLSTIVTLTGVSQSSHTGASDPDDDACEDEDYEYIPSPTTLSTIVSVSQSAYSSPPTVVSHNGHAPKTCKAVAPPPARLTCGTEGYISQNELTGRWPVQKKNSLAECATLCYTGPDCTAFHYREDGNCQIFIKTWASYGFYPSTSGTYWYQKECFECSDADAVLDVDFHDRNVSNWSLKTEVDGSFYMDVQTADGIPALRILESATEGEAQVNYLPEFEVEAETTYELVFNARSNLPVNQQTGMPETDFKLLTFYVYTHDDVIFETIPVNGAWTGGQGWLKFSSKFVVQKGEEGAATLAFTVHASGSQLDWYLGYLYIKKV
ncbi:hypothetical protein BGZ61DRAFT_592790 [Ilyonectria robusta]|uniref:uncharacterized protein n=1 Tax=Ilyonectria robusta TaxID=1079257 RepID=UPI001E8DE7AE|nr:uncharacterized protein BGZ61DRAFT_592790 [Ilyonectria robusta]KAH8666062.1 hypothetical protein BGZ61DRAFT_592790 [Ilyonectria robusta]